MISYAPDSGSYCGPNIPFLPAILSSLLGGFVQIYSVKDFLNRRHILPTIKINRSNHRFNRRRSRLLRHISLLARIFGDVVYQPTLLSYLTQFPISA